MAKSCPTSTRPGWYSSAAGHRGASAGAEPPFRPCKMCRLPSPLPGRRDTCSPGKGVHVARPRYSVEEVRKALVESRGLVYTAAARLNCCPRTVLYYKARHKVLREACEHERGRQLDLAELKLYAAIDRGEPW